MSASAAAVAGAAAGLAIAMPVGPISVLLVDLGVRRGARAALAAGLGVALADGAYALAAVLVGGAIADLLAPAADALRLVSAGVLVAVGVLLLRGALRDPGAVTEAAAPPAGGATTLRFLALTIVNPPTAAYFASLVLGLPAVAEGTPDERAAFALMAFLASLAWQSTVALTGALLGHALPGSARRVTGVIGGVVVLALALRVLTA